MSKKRGFMEELLEKAIRRLDDLEKKVELYYKLLRVENELDFVLKGTYLMPENLDVVIEGTY